MSYKWNIEKIREVRDSLIKEMLKEPDNEYLVQLYDNYTYMIDLFLMTKTGKERFNDVYYDDVEEETENYFYDYSYIPNNITNSIISSVKIYKNFKYNDRYDNYQISKIQMSNDDLFYIVKDIFYSLDNKKIKYLFDKFATKDLIHIAFNRFDFNDFGGIMLNDSKNNIPYSFVLRNNTLEDIDRLTHEIGHMIFRYDENYDYNDTNKVFLSEVEGNFFDYLSFDKINELFSNNIDTKIMLQRKINISKECINEFIKNMEKEKKFLLEDEVKDDAIDIISFFVSIDLFNQYRLDKEKSLYDLENIIKINSNNINKDLEKYDVTYFKDDFKNIKKLIKEKKL